MVDLNLLLEIFNLQLQSRIPLAKPGYEKEMELRAVYILLILCLSCTGLIVSVLLCFLNKEVQVETLMNIYYGFIHHKFENLKHIS